MQKKSQETKNSKKNVDVERKSLGIEKIFEARSVSDRVSCLTEKFSEEEACAEAEEDFD